MTVSAVIGLGFGDEGKGLVTNALCEHYPKDNLVVRYCGGQQAGHTVVTANTSHVFANFGSGSFQNIPTYWSKFCTVDPRGILVELGVLETKGIKPVLYIDAECPVTTPFEIEINKTHSQYRSHGTCGVGVGLTIQREENHFSILAKDFLYPEVLKIKIELLKQHYGVTIDKNKIATWLFEIEHLLGHDHIQIVYGLPKAKHYTFEGSQGLMLDQNIGFFPHVTRSNTGTKNIFNLVKNIDTLYLITRVYQTRHGNGPMTNKHLNTNFIYNPDETNKYHRYQGEFKKTILDADLLKYAMDSDNGIRNIKRKILVITCCDQIKEEFKFTIKEKLWGFNKIDNFGRVLAKHLEIDEFNIVDNPTGFKNDSK